MVPCGGDQSRVEAGEAEMRGVGESKQLVGTISGDPVTAFASAAADRVSDGDACQHAHAEKDDGGGRVGGRDQRA